MAVKEALVWPDETPTLPGTVMFALLLDNVTVDPPAGAADVKVTVQLDVPGAFTVAGEQLRLLGCVVTVSAMVANWFMPFKEPVTVTFWAALTEAVVAAKLAVLWVAAMVTLAGTDRDPLLLLKETMVVTVAALFRETVQVLDALLPSDVGEQETEVSCAGALPVSVKV